MGADSAVSDPSQAGAVIGSASLWSQDGPDRMTRILVIDDNSGIRQLLRATLEDTGYEVVEADNGRTGLERLDEETFSVIVCDIMMPEMDGLEAIREIREKHGQTKIVAISGGGTFGQTHFLKMAETLGADRHLRKPFEPDDLVATIQDLLKTAA